MGRSGRFGDVMMMSHGRGLHWPGSGLNFLVIMRIHVHMNVHIAHVIHSCHTFMSYIRTHARGKQAHCNQEVQTTTRSVQTTSM